MTGDLDSEFRLDEQLNRDRLTNAGTQFVRPSFGKTLST